MSKSTFQFRHFQITQAVNPAKVGTDGILLGAWADLDKAERIIDVGTGTGLIALMAAQRNPSARIHGIELNEAAEAEARGNFARSPWSDRISLFCGDIRSFSPPDLQPYDVLVSNPPFFQDGKLPDSAERQNWRHQTALRVSDLLVWANEWVAPAGRIELILPVAEGENAMQGAGIFGWHCQRKIAVLPTPQKPASRLLLSFSRIPQKPISDQIIIQTGGPNEYSPEFIRLTRDFYPWMD